jgi:hypothetical protein
MRTPCAGVQRCATASAYVPAILLQFARTAFQERLGREFRPDRSRRAGSHTTLDKAPDLTHLLPTMSKRRHVWERVNMLLPFADCQGIRQIADSFYDLATDFYEYGWGNRFISLSRLPGSRFVTRSCGMSRDWWSGRPCGRTGPSSASAVASAVRRETSPGWGAQSSASTTTPTGLAARSG